MKINQFQQKKMFKVYNRKNWKKITLGKDKLKCEIKSDKIFSNIKERSKDTIINQLTNQKDENGVKYVGNIHMNIVAKKMKN